MLLLAAVFLLLGSGYCLARSFFALPESADVQPPGQVSGDEEKPALSGRLNILLLGVDTRESEPVARADTLILASVDPDKKRAVVVSIPRDTRVMIPGVGWEKINATSVYGGYELTTKVVSKLLNVPVDYYAACNYQGFIDIIDTLGGVTVNVEKNMYHYDPEEDGIWTINLKKGRQRLDGRQALMYVRYRGYDLGDITRTQHQQNFLRALVDEVMQPATIAKLPKLVPKVFKCIDTNLGLNDMVKLARAAQSFSEYDIVSQTLPGYFLEVDGISFWEVDAAKARTMVARLYNGETIADVVEGSRVVKTEVASTDGTSADGGGTDGTSGQAAGETPKGASGEGSSSSGQEAGGRSGSEEYAGDPNIVITPKVPGDDVSGGTSETGGSFDGTGSGGESQETQPGSREPGGESWGTGPASEGAGEQSSDIGSSTSSGTAVSGSDSGDTGGTGNETNFEVSGEEDGAGTAGTSNNNGGGDSTGNGDSAGDVNDAGDAGGSSDAGETVIPILS